MKLLTGRRWASRSRGGKTELIAAATELWPGLCAHAQLERDLLHNCVPIKFSFYINNLLKMFHAVFHGVVDSTKAEVLQDEVGIWSATMA